MSYLTQMLGLTVQNFVSAAAGMADAGGHARAEREDLATAIGNFWVDLTRGTLYILLPLSLVLALALVSQGVVQNLSGATPRQRCSTHDRCRGQEVGEPDARARAGRLASGHQAVGTNGGGSLNANSAAPFENATPRPDFLLSARPDPAILPATYTFGRMVGDTRRAGPSWRPWTMVLAA